MKVIDRDRIHLAKGSHSGSIPEEPDCEVCFFEAYNLLTLPPGLANPIITDKRPPDVSLVLHRFGMRLNDVLPDDRRQTLKVYLPNGRSSLAGTVSDGLDDVRRWMAADWAVRTATPAWLDAAGQPEAAARLRALGPIVDRTTYEAAWTVVRPVRDEMRELRNARFAELRARYAAAAAVADAVAAAVAAAAAVAGYSTTTYHKVYDAVLPIITARFEPVTAELQQGALDLYARMIRPLERTVK